MPGPPTRARSVKDTVEVGPSRWSLGLSEGWEPRRLEATEKPK